MVKQPEWLRFTQPHFSPSLRGWDDRAEIHRPPPPTKPLHQLRRIVEQPSERGSFWGGSRAAVGVTAPLQNAVERPPPASLRWGQWTIKCLCAACEERLTHAANVTNQWAGAQNQHFTDAGYVCSFVGCTITCLIRLTFSKLPANSTYLKYGKKNVLDAVYGVEFCCGWQ